MPSIQYSGPVASQPLAAVPAIPQTEPQAIDQSIPPAESLPTAAQDRHLAAAGSLPQALTSLNLLEEPGARGSKHFEDLAIRADSWSKVNQHFRKVYNGRSSEREADIDKMAQRLNLPGAEFKPLMQGLYASKVLGPMAIDLGTAELFFRRLGPDKGKQVIARLESFQADAGSRLSPAERSKLASSLFRDLAVPGMIGQGGKGSCAAASMHVMLASAQPDAFLEMSLNLAEGKPYTLPDGASLKPNDDWRSNEDRQLSEAVIQNALMDMMLGAGVYHSNLDTGANQTAPSAGQQTKGLEKLSGHRLDYDDSSTIMIWPLSSLSASSSMGYLEDELSRGRPVLVNIWGHAMAVVGMDKTGPEPKALVSTYGAQIEMPAADLEKYLMHSITVDDAGSDNQRIPQGRRVVIGTDLGRLPH